nr:Tad domain-containing protein [Evansella sp. LMS18]
MGEERGQALVLAALFIAMLFGFAGLVVDGGQLYTAKSELQKAVDAGALAGSNTMLEGKQNELGFNHGVSKTNAKNLANINYAAENYEVSFPEDHIIEVVGTTKVSTTLMRILGFTEDNTVRAEAQAIVYTPRRVEEGNVIPFGSVFGEEFSNLEFGDTWDFTSEPGEGTNGYFGILNFSHINPNSNSNNHHKITNYLNNGAPGPIAVGRQIRKLPGNLV